jgi:hypothetical protein
MKRGYLNRDESNQLMVIMAAVQLINGERNLEGKAQKPMWEDWTNRGMMDKEQAKWLKTANTYLNKFIVEKLKDLDKEEQVKILKKIQKFDFKLVDDYTLQKLFRDMSDKMKFMTMQREDGYKWTEEIMSANCKNCTKDRQGCELHKIFEDNIIPESSWDLPNCEYSYFPPEVKKNA